MFPVFTGLGVTPSTYCFCVGRVGIRSCIGMVDIKQMVIAIMIDQAVAAHIKGRRAVMKSPSMNMDRDFFYPAFGSGDTLGVTEQVLQWPIALMNLINTDRAFWSDVVIHDPDPGSLPLEVLEVPRAPHECPPGRPAQHHPVVHRKPVMVFDWPGFSIYQQADEAFTTPQLFWMQPGTIAGKMPSGDQEIDVSFFDGEGGGGYDSLDLLSP